VAKLRVPSEIQRAFRQLADLPAPEYEKLLDVTRALDPERVAADLDDAFDRAWPNAPPSVRSSLWAIASLYAGMLETRESVDDFIRDLVRVLLASGVFQEAEQEQLRERLAPFLDVRAFSLGVRAGNVMYDNQRNFDDARTLTDIRPVFSTDANLEIERAVIVHYLKIMYTEAGRRDEFFVTLDDDDVRRLMETLERAQRKSRSIDAFLKHIGDHESAV